MTLEQIKNEITASLKEVRESSRDFSSCESYDDLQKLFKKAIGRIALCETAEELEAAGDLLMAIEELYNDCNSELLNQPSELELFSFDFELDTDVDKPFENNESESGESGSYEDEDEDEDEDEVTEADEEETDSPKKTAPKAPVKKASKSEKSDNKSSKKNLHQIFDQKISVKKMKAINSVRLCVGSVALLSGIGFGLVDALWWPWVWQAWATVGFGCSYILLSAVYSAVIRAVGQKAARAMAVTRLVLAVVMLALGIALGAVFEDSLTLLGGLTATLPFTAFGVMAYLIYTIRIRFSALKLK